MKRKVLVLLSTYNGDRFLREQLESLYGQEGVDYHILVRDDGSSDETIAILEEYKKQKAHMTIMRGGQNVGPAWSFFLLMEEAHKNYDDYDYYAFCDQDDIWYPDKLKRAVVELDVSEKVYRFYSSGYYFINAKGKIIGILKPTFTNFKTVLFRTTCIGCSQMFSKGVLEKACLLAEYLEKVGVDVRTTSFHDSWLARIAYYEDSYIIYDSKPSFLYRQHDRNVTCPRGDSLIEKIKAKYFEDTKIKNKQFSRNARYLQDVIGDDMSNEKKDFINRFIQYDNSWCRTFLFALQYAYLFKEKVRVTLYAFSLIISRHF